MAHRLTANAPCGGFRTCGVPRDRGALAPGGITGTGPVMTVGCVAKMGAATPAPVIAQLVWAISPGSALPEMAGRGRQ